MKLFSYFKVLAKTQKNILFTAIVFLIILAITVVNLFHSKSQLQSLIAIALATLFVIIILHKFSHMYHDFIAGSKFIDSGLDDESLRRLAIHEAGHLIVALCFTKKVFVSKQTTLNSDETITFQSVRAEILLGQKQDAFLIAAGPEAESFFYGESKFCLLDNREIEDKRYGRLLEHKIHLLKMFIETNKQTIVEMAEVIYNSDKKILDYSDFEFLVPKIKNEGLIV